jgi:hypothetical protein
MDRSPHANTAPAQGRFARSPMLANSFIIIRLIIPYSTIPICPHNCRPIHLHRALHYRPRTPKFNFLCQYAAPQISSTFSDEFGNRFVLQATHYEPVVRRAAIALCLLHEKFTLHDSTSTRRRATSEDESFALSQYVKALDYLLQPAKVEGKQTADVALMTCILFVCFETLRGYHSTVLKHVDAGIKTLSELSSMRTSTSLSVSPSPYIPSQHSTGSSSVSRHKQRPSPSAQSGSYSPQPTTLDQMTTTNTSPVHSLQSKTLEYIRIVGSQAPRTYFRMGEDELPNSTEAICTVTAPFSTQLFVEKSCPPSPLEAAKTEVTIELIRSSSALRGVGMTGKWGWRGGLAGWKLGFRATRRERRRSRRGLGIGCLELEMGRGWWRSGLSGEVGVRTVLRI